MKKNQKTCLDIQCLPANEDILEANLLFHISKKFDERLCDFQNGNMDRWIIQESLDQFIKQTKKEFDIVSIQDATIHLDQLYYSNINLKVLIATKNFNQLEKIKVKLAEFLQHECDKRA